MCVIYEEDGNKSWYDVVSSGARLSPAWCGSSASICLSIVLAKSNLIEQPPRCLTHLSPHIADSSSICLVVVNISEGFMPTPLIYLLICFLPLASPAPICCGIKTFLFHHALDLGLYTTCTNSRTFSPVHLSALNPPPTDAHRRITWPPIMAVRRTEYSHVIRNPLSLRINPQLLIKCHIYLLEWAFHPQVGVKWRKGHFQMKNVIKWKVLSKIITLRWTSHFESSPSVCMFPRNFYVSAKI